jgi:hypothetical protein
MDRVKFTDEKYIKNELKLQLLIMYFCGKCNMFYTIMNYVHTRIVVCCYRGRVGTDLSVVWVAY